MSADDLEQIARRVDALEALVLDDGDVLHFRRPDWLTPAQWGEIRVKADAHWDTLVAAARLAS